MGRARVVLADDHPEFLPFVAGLLEPEFEIVETVKNGLELLAAAARLDPDLLVVDISMPEMNGLEAARELRTARSRAKLVFLTVHQDEDFVQTALGLGAQGYVVKHRLASDLLPALREVLGGRIFISSP
jgi:DNA-binding NarL/FixJ family response regulator